MMQNLSIRAEEIKAELRKNQILSAAEVYREELIHLANNRLGNMKRSRQLVKTALRRLSKKENLEKVIYIFRSWLHVYINYLCDLQLQISDKRLQMLRSNSGSKNIVSPLLILHQAKGDLLTYSRHSSPAT